MAAPQPKLSPLALRALLPLALLGAGLACSGVGSDPPPPRPVLPEDLADLQANRLSAPEPGPQLGPLLQTGVPQGNAKDGVQVLQIAPVGVVNRPIQAAVIFDRPMVPLTDLDTMTEAVPLSCDPPWPVRPRWAGSSTAVLLPEPDKAFPRATAFTCKVPAGIKALDGQALQSDITWSFETERPRVLHLSPRNGANDVDPKAPLLLTLSHDHRVEQVTPLVHLTSRGRDVPLTLSEVADSPRTLQVSAELLPNTPYTLVVDAGLPTTEGPLTGTQRFEASFSTYPPLTVVNGPAGQLGPGDGFAIEFSTRVPADSASPKIHISPEPKDWSTPSGSWGSTHWYASHWLQPRTRYTVRVDPGITDIYGQVLAEGAQFEFTTKDFDPWIDVGTGFQVYAGNNPKELPIRHLNLDRVQVRAAAVPLDQIGGDSWYDLTQRAVSGADYTELTTEDVANQVEIDFFDLKPYLNEAGYGVVALETTSPGLKQPWDDEPVRYRSLFVVTDLGASLKISPEGLEAWVTRLSDASLVPGVEVSFYRGSELLGQAVADEQGLARLASGPGRNWYQWNDESALWVTLRLGEEVGLAHQRWDDATSPWRFGHYSEFVAAGEVWRVDGYTDRGIYKLGDPVFARAVFRSMDAQALQLPGACPVSWNLSDPEGGSVASGSGALDARGGFDVATQLPAEGKLATWSLDVRADCDGTERSVYLPVPVKAYRPPTFKVTVGTEAAHAVVGQEIKPVVDARYLFGAAIRSGDLRWSAWIQGSGFRPPGYDEWQIGVSSWEESGEEGGGNYGMLSEEAGELEGGHDTWSVSVPPERVAGHPVELVIEAQVTTPDRQAIANSATLVVHPGQFYLASKTPGLGQAGQPLPVQVVAVDPQGEAKPTTAKLTVVRRTWNRVREKTMDGRWTWNNTTVDTPITTETVQLGAAPGKVSFTPPEPGYYRLNWEATDPAGQVVRTLDTVYAIGAGQVSWALDDGNKLELVPDKKRYAPGETAQILVKTPRPGLTALVTTEHLGVLERWVVPLPETATAVPIPIARHHAPNVFVSVLVVEGAAPQLTPDDGRSVVWYGLTELQVRVDDSELGVTVSADRADYRPGDEVTVEVEVKRGATPANGAGVTLYAVDEAVLSLTAYSTPEQHDAFWQPRPLSVLTSDSRNAVYDRAPYLTKGAPVGGGGGLEEGSDKDLRKNFVTTPLWRSDLTTGKDGKVKASFKLPDNLTAFRLMAVADHEADAFGSGQTEVRVNRPILVQPALPRFLRRGDAAFAGVVVHNYTDSPRTVTVSATVEGPLTLRGDAQRVSVPALDAIEVPFTLIGQAPGTARLRFVAESGEDRDALEVKLPISEVIVQDTVATAGTTDGRLEEAIELPKGARPDEGGLTVDLASTILVGAGTGLSYLWDYPHGCVEQRTSRAFASLVALQVREAAGVQVAEADLRRNVQVVLDQLETFQAWDGGLGYWPNPRESHILGTAYAVELMGRAQEAGFTVDTDLLNELANYLNDALAGRRGELRGWSIRDRLSTEANILVALARVKRADAAHLNRVYAGRSDLSLQATAALLEALARSEGVDARVEELRRQLEGRAYLEAASAQIKETNGSWRLWSSDDWTTAATLEAFLVAFGEHPMAPRLARHLALNRRDGRWHNTRATAAVLAALAAYADRYEPDGGEVQALVALGGSTLYQSALPIPATAQSFTPMSDLKPGKLSFQAEGGRLYYEARLAYAPAKPEARDEGFTVRRDLRLLEGGGSQGEVVGGSVIEITLTVVTPVDRHAVAVLDPLPAGWEAIDTGLATSSRRPSEEEEDDGEGLGSDELPYGASWSFDHRELRDDAVALYATDLRAGVHVFRYLARATTPGSFDFPPATAEEMYEPEHFGRTVPGRMVVGASLTAP